MNSLATDNRVRAVAVNTWALPNEQLEAVLGAGARGALAKSMSGGDLADALLAVEAGSRVVSPEFRRPHDAAWPGHDFGLTAVESEVAAFLAEGLSNRSIADALLCISEHTVKSHLKSVFRKVDVTSRAQAVAAHRRRCQFPPDGGALNGHRRLPASAARWRVEPERLGVLGDGHVGAPVERLAIARRSRNGPSSEWISSDATTMRR